MGSGKVMNSVLDVQSTRHWVIKVNPHSEQLRKGIWASAWEELRPLSCRLTSRMHPELTHQPGSLVERQNMHVHCVCYVWA